MREWEQVRTARPGDDLRRRSGQALLPGAATHLLSIQRLAGNAAVTAMLAQRKIAAADGTDPDMGPVAEIADSALTGARKKAADQALGYIDSGTPLLDQPWVKAKVAANSGKVPNSVKKFKWGENHQNRDGHLPGKKGAGGYKEYYLRTGDAEADPLSPTDRLVISTGSNTVFHTATHYGRDGSPAFTHYR